MGVLLYGVEFRPDCNEHVYLRDLLCLFSEVGERIGGLFDEGTENPNNSFHRPLSQKRGRPNPGGFRTEMCKRVHTLPNEVQALDLPLIIQKFKLKDPLKKEFVGEEELLARDPVLVHDPDANN